MNLNRDDEDDYDLDNDYDFEDDYEEEEEESPKRASFFSRRSDEDEEDSEPKLRLFGKPKSSANERKAFLKIQEDLIAAGYRIYPNLYKFEEYGVPQARHRMIIVGIRDDLPFEFKIPSAEPYKNLDVTCKSAIEIPPISEDAANNELTKQSEKVVANTIRYNIQTSFSNPLRIALLTLSFYSKKQLSR